MSEELKTVTLNIEGQPVFSLCPGHVDLKAFLKAFKAEGWSGDDLTDYDLQHEYWLPADHGNWYQAASKEDLGAKPFTVMEW